MKGSRKKHRCLLYRLEKIHANCQQIDLQALYSVFRRHVRFIRSHFEILCALCVCTLRDDITNQIRDFSASIIFFVKFATSFMDNMPTRLTAFCRICVNAVWKNCACFWMANHTHNTRFWNENIISKRVQVPFLNEYNACNYFAARLFRFISVCHQGDCLIGRAHIVHQPSQVIDQSNLQLFA